MADLPKLKHPRFREVARKLGNRTRKIQQGFFIPGPNAKAFDKGVFRCPAGPGMGPIPLDGRWYDVTDYLLRCVLHGDAAEGTPPKKTKKPAPKDEPKGKE